MGGCSYIRNDSVVEAWKVGTDELPRFIRSVEESSNGGYVCKTHDGHAITVYQGEWVVKGKSGLEWVSDAWFKANYSSIEGPRVSDIPGTSGERIYDQGSHQFTSTDLVRCKDCVFGKPCKLFDKDAIKCWEFGWSMAPNGYCSYGRRKQRHA